LACRSVAYSDLNSRFELSKDTAIIHQFFDYNSKRTQTAAGVSMFLLISRFDEIPDEIKSLYSSGEEPSIAKCNQFLTSCSKKFKKIYVIFDAIDEYSQVSQNEIFELLEHLQSIRCHLLVSSRLHLQEQLRKLLADCQTLEISAKESDLSNYINTKLRQKGDRNEELTTQCIQLARDNNGM
jgi:hypothetical protein